MDSEKNERIYLFDNLKFILIFLVVFGHCIMIFVNDITLRVYMYIYLFHMPTFAFISGYFFKRRNKKVLSFIVKYFAFQCLYLLLASIIDKNTNFNMSSIFDPYWIMWYMYCLIFWNIIMNIIEMKNQKLGIILIGISIIMAILAGTIENINTKYSLSRMIAFFPFFLSGIYCKKFIDIRKLKCSKKVKCIFILIFIVIALLTFYLPIANSYEALYYSKPYSVVGITPGIRLLQYIIGFIFIVGFLIIIPNKKYKLSFIGANTEYIYLLHGFIIMILQSMSRNYPSFIQDWIKQLILYFVLTILIIAAIMGAIISVKKLVRRNNLKDKRMNST